MIARCVLLLVIAPAVAVAQSLPGPEKYYVRAEYTRWSKGMNSEIKKGFGTADGTLLDLTNDLGVKDEGTWQARATIRLGQSFKLRGSYLPLDKYKGDTIAKTNFLYGGQQYFAGSCVVTSINGNYYTGEFEWYFRRCMASFRGLLVQAQGFQMGSTVGLT